VERTQGGGERIAEKKDRFLSISLFIFLFFILHMECCSLSTGCTGHQVRDLKQVMMWTNRRWCVKKSVLVGVLVALLICTIILTFMIFMLLAIDLLLIRPLEL
jgi:hypothetical protein